MRPDSESRELPPFLRDAGAFSLHLQENFAEHTNVEKGDGFVKFACKVLPLCEFWKDMPPPEPNAKRSHDGGVDLIATHPESGECFAGQSKFRMRSVEDLDGTISKFAAHDTDQGSVSGQWSLFPKESISRIKYIIVTSSDLSEIVRRYRDTNLPSRGFHDRLRREQRLEILDGPRLLETIQSLYRQSFFIAPQLKLELSADVIEIDSVYLSVISAKVLRDLYAENKDSLFFENIREFLGVGNGDDSNRGSVNESIAATLRECPEKMLGRNNGITFRADSVEIIDRRTIVLEKGSIVNGCQTTMCIATTGEAADTAKVAVKVVAGKGEISWEVAKYANYQNQVSRLELELAKFLRPQAVRKAAIELGYAVSTEKDQSISIVLDEIHHTRVSYEALRLLYIGLFSRYPNNIIQGHYSEVLLKVLDVVSMEGRQEHTMTVLFLLLEHGERAARAFKQRHKDEKVLDLFKRFFRAESPRYSCLLALLAACGCVNDDLARQDGEDDDRMRWARLQRFLDRLEIVLRRHSDYFVRVYRHAVTALTFPAIQSASDRDDLLQRMSKEILASTGQRFPLLVSSVRTMIMNDDSLAELASRIDFGKQTSSEAEDPSGRQSQPRKTRTRTRT
jgi:AIPR protein